MAASRIETFREMLENDPANTALRFGLANEYLKAELFGDAISALEEYLRRADDEGAAFGMLARACEKQGDRDRAREAYLSGIKAAESHGHPSMADEYRTALSTDYED
jgi:predicted Zn-dependent protease